MKIDPSSLVERQPKSGNLKYKENINFAIFYLSMSGLLTTESRGLHAISENRLEVTKRDLSQINVRFLEDINTKFKNRIESHYKNKTNIDDYLNKSASEDKLNPEKRLYEAERLIRETVKNEMLENLKRISPRAFEEVCRRFMFALGYGYDENSGLTTQYSHDSGIDGYIYGDKLGLEKISFQSKRFDEQTVGIKEFSSFYGVIDKE